MQSFQKNQLVWAKVKGYSWWPALITSSKVINPEAKGREIEVNFVGDNTYAILPLEHIANWESNYCRYSKIRNKKLQEAIKVSKQLEKERSFKGQKSNARTPSQNKTKSEKQEEKLVSKGKILQMNAQTLSNISNNVDFKKSNHLQQQNLKSKQKKIVPNSPRFLVKKATPIDLITPDFSRRSRSRHSSIVFTMDQTHPCPPKSSILINLETDRKTSIHKSKVKNPENQHENPTMINIQSASLVPSVIKIDSTQKSSKITFPTSTQLSIRTQNLKRKLDNQEKKKNHIVYIGSSSAKKFNENGMEYVGKKVKRSPDLQEKASEAKSSNSSQKGADHIAKALFAYKCLMVKKFESDLRELLPNFVTKFQNRNESTDDDHELTMILHILEEFERTKFDGPEFIGSDFGKPLKTLYDLFVNNRNILTKKEEALILILANTLSNFAEKIIWFCLDNKDYAEALHIPNKKIEKENSFDWNANNLQFYQERTEDTAMLIESTDIQKELPEEMDIKILKEIEKRYTKKIQETTGKRERKTNKEKMISTKEESLINPLTRRKACIDGKFNPKLFPE